jgi:hypothetical protein
MLGTIGELESYKVLQDSIATMIIGYAFINVGRKWAYEDYEYVKYYIGCRKKKHSQFNIYLFDIGLCLFDVIKVLQILHHSYLFFISLID